MGNTLSLAKGCAGALDRLRGFRTDFLILDGSRRQRIGHHAEQLNNRRQLPGLQLLQQCVSHLFVGRVCHQKEFTTANRHSSRRFNTGYTAKKRGALGPASSQTPQTLTADTAAPSASAEPAPWSA